MEVSMAMGRPKTELVSSVGQREQLRESSQLALLIIGSAPVLKLRSTKTA